MIEHQITLQFLGISAVAFVAMLSQHGTDFLFKELEVCRGEFSTGQRTRRPENSRQ